MVISVLETTASNGSKKSRSWTQAIRTNTLESILIASFSIVTVLLILPYESINGDPVPTLIFKGLPSSTFHAFVVSLVFAFTASLSALLIHDSCSFLAMFCEFISMPAAKEKQNTSMQ